ncbi:MAG: tyrosine-protein phosphatase [Deltaproteobacteria bacterium]
MTAERIELEGAVNFRDLGGYATTGGGRVRHGRVFRSDGLHRLVASDVTKLEALGIGRVFDLRSPLEISSDGVGPFAAGAGRHVHVPLLELSLNVYDGQIDWQNVDLNERYVEMLKVGGRAITTIFGQAAESSGPPIVFHCTGGKDRAGVVSAVLLRVLGVADDDVVADYAVSESYLGGFLEQYRDAMMEAGMDPALIEYVTSSPPERMRHALGELDRIWGSTEEYLAAIGLEGRTLDALRAALVEPV